MGTTNQTENLTVRIDSRTKELAKELAKRQGISTSELVKRLLTKAQVEHGLYRNPRT